MVIGLFLGIMIGINIGLYFGKHLMEKMYKPLIESYKKDVDYWFKAYLEMSERQSKNFKKYVELLISNIEKGK